MPFYEDMKLRIKVYLTPYWSLSTIIEGQREKILKCFSAKTKKLPIYGQTGQKRGVVAQANHKFRYLEGAFILL